MTAPSYHALHIETATIPRTSIFNLPYGLMVCCTRVGAWELCRFDIELNDYVVLAGEFNPVGLRLDVNGVIIADSLTTQEVNNEQQAKDEQAQDQRSDSGAAGGRTA